MIDAPNEVTDEQLLLLLAEGERSALDRLFLRHSAKVYGFAQKKGLSPEEAEDIVQIVFLQLWRKKHLYDSQYSALAWIFVISKSEIRDAKQRDKAKNFQTEFDETLSQSPAQLPKEIERYEADQEVKEAMSGLKPRELEVVKQRWIEDLDYPEIAKRLNESESNIRQIASRSLRIMRDLMSRQKPNGPKPDGQTREQNRDRQTRKEKK